MCQFVSWIEKDGAVLFLTGKQVYHTKRGKELRDYTKNTGDMVGHGAIRWFYEIDGGKDIECTDFRSPSNFPAVIIEAIKGGEMRGMGTPNGLLTRKAYAEYLKVCAAAYTEYLKVSAAAWAEYEKVRNAASAEYEKVIDAAFWDLFDDPRNRRKKWR